jgi:2-C-methyl-D-erythritol 2,4-cyclodiphosphate synthase
VILAIMLWIWSVPPSLSFSTNSMKSAFGARDRPSAAPHVDASSLSATRATNDGAIATNSDSLMSPEYEIERLPVRIGHGFDIHRMAPREVAGQPVVIAGVEIPHSDQKWTDAEGKYGPPGGIYECQLGVVAHSDGDVVYHSIVDAIFGALTLPDIGQVFQDSDPRWKGCDSSKFMEYAADVMAKYGYQVGNVDVTLILERPKVASFKPKMKDNIVKLLNTTPGRVNIKARTHERVDSVGELRSLSCHVVLTLERCT